MGWRAVVINKHSKISYKNHHLYFRSVDQQEMIHLSEIDILLLETTDIVLTTMLIEQLVKENILVLFCDTHRLPTAMLAPFYGRHDSSLQLTKQIAWSTDIKEIVWTEVISQKILNQSQFLKQHEFFEKADTILYFHDELRQFDPTNREGHAARAYFQSLFGTKFSREQDNDINAGLNYGYTLLLSIFAREIVKNGCLTQLGLKHSNQFNDFNLASDLMEPFRWVVDEIVYDHKDESFKVIKRMLFSIFSNVYPYRNQQMFLTNIVADYVKRAVKVLNLEQEGVPEFRR